MSLPGVIQVTEQRTITVQVAGEMNPQYLSDTSPSYLERGSRSSQEDGVSFFRSPPAPLTYAISPAVIACFCLFTCRSSIHSPTILGPLHLHLVAPV